MKHFMGNICGFGNCLSTDCDKCGHYKPTLFGLKIPKKFAKFFFKLEHKLIYKQ